ncbi:MAG: hypothetical protein IT449_09945 [Phycisphaerales bacterium]|nr:hypothetical protein [Phycisphaerales bacterium]
MMGFNLLLLAVCLHAPDSPSLQEAAASSSPESAYLDEARLGRRLSEMVARNPRDCALSTYGASRGGRDLWVLRVGRGEDVDQRPALVLIAGLDGDTFSTTDVAIRVVESVMNASQPSATHGDLLDRQTIYLIPRANPDACASFFAPVKLAQRTTLRPIDDDRDGLADEDGPDDVNCDGKISLMRKLDPEATHLPDPAEPRLLKEPDRAKGQKPIYKVYTEGIDDDGDGEYNEDGVGGVDLNRNFPHGYAEHEPSSGPHTISEPESKALIDFFLAHPNIAVAVVYGRYDNIVKLPEAGRMDVTQRAPVSLHKDDAAIYEQLSKRYKEITGVKELVKDEEVGALHGWAYAQFGVPAFACRVWTRPEESRSAAPESPKPAEPLPATQPEPPAAQPEPAAAQPEPAAATGAPPAETPPPPSAAPTEPPVKSSDQTNKPADPSAKPAEKPEPADKEAVAWLAYSDTQRQGQGFMPWTPFEHPQLGPVEIGGFDPFFQTTPPPDQLDAVAAKQTEFLSDLLGRFPKPVLEELKVKALSDHVFEIESAVVNDGYLPTATAMGAQTRRVRPMLVTLELPLERIVGGERLSRFGSIPGSGGREKLRWLVLGQPGDPIAVTLTSPRFGNAQQIVTLPQGKSPAAP